MNWTITTLIENHMDKEGRYACEHGLSVLIEGQDFRMLMDTGESGAFYDNSLRMGISLSHLDALLFSHAHYDHTGGLLRLVKEGDVPERIYVGRHFFRKCYHSLSDGRMKYIGTKFDSQMIKDLRLPVEEIDADEKEIAPGITVFRNFPQVTAYEEYNPDFFYQEEDPSCGPYGRCVDSMSYHPDIFEDELAVALDTDDGLFVIVGCSHPGIVNILTAISERTGKKICGLIGGTHLMDADETRVKKTIGDFKKFGVKTLGVSHCTGDGNIEILKDSFGDSFMENYTGNVIRI